MRADDDVNVTEILQQCNCSEVWWGSFVSNESLGVKGTERFDSSIMRERLDMACKIPVKKKKVCHSENLTADFYLTLMVDTFFHTRYKWHFFSLVIFVSLFLTKFSSGFWIL